MGSGFKFTLIWLLAVAAALILAAILWWPKLDSPPRYPGANVVLISIDTLRADRLGSYGYQSAETPRLDALAAEGIRFEEVVAPVPLTLPSHTSLMTSMSPPSHGVRDNAAFEVSAEARMLAEIFRKAGYQTGAFIGAYVLHSRWGLARGFETYDDHLDYGRLTSVPKRVERRGDVVVEATLDWLNQQGEAPFFAWVHLYDPHDPYEAPEPYGSRFSAEPYDGEVAYSDFLVGRILDGLSERGMAEETIVIVTSDHGEGLDEHDEATHGFFLYDPTVLVPLIIRLPDQETSGREVPEQVRLIDVAPTVLELVEIPMPASFEGESLMPFLSGKGNEAADRPAYSETYVPRLHFGWQELHALRRDGYKYILAPRPELYRVDADPGEEENLIEIETDRAAAMRTELDELRGSEDAVSPGKLSSEERQNLAALGYIGTPPAVLPEGPLEDPKDKIGLVRRLSEGRHLLEAGKATDAEKLLEGFIVENPRMVDAHLVLGNARQAQGDHAGAVEAFEAIMALDPEHDIAFHNLGMAKLGIGDREAAREIFEARLRTDPTSLGAHFQLGEMDLEEQKPQRALQQFEAGLATHDNVPALLFGLGVAAWQLGDVERAASAFERCAKAVPSFPQVHYYLALVAEARGNGSKAIEKYRAEVENSPDHYESWFNLSLQLIEAQDLTGAIDALRRTIAAKPDLAVAHLYLGQALLVRGDPQFYSEAAEAAQRGLALNPPPELRTLGQGILSEVSQRLGRTVP